MGWAFKTTGFKANPADVAKATMTTRDDNGDRMFTSEEFLTTQQVSSFFSRLASKKQGRNSRRGVGGVTPPNVKKKCDWQGNCM